MPYRGRPFEHVDEVVAGAARRAEWAARQGHRRHGGRPPAIFGVLFIAMGVLWLLDTLDIVDARAAIRTYWPVLPLGLGLLWMVSCRGLQRWFGALATLLAAALLANKALGWNFEIWSLIWPLALIALGLHFLFVAVGPRRHWEAMAHLETGTDEEAEAAEPDFSARFRISVVTATVKRKNASQALAGGVAAATLGELRLDLRECRMAGDSVEVDLAVSLGNIEMEIPKGWLVESDVKTTLANFEDNTERPIDPQAKRFIVRGHAFLGNIEIRN